MLKGALAIFVKTPGVSPLKTRLGKTIGSEKAESFYLKSLKDTEGLIQKAVKDHPQLSAYWAVAEKDQMDHRLWASFACLWQGEGGLGDRMLKIYNELLESNDFVFLMGSDSPHLSSQTLSLAIEKMQNEMADFVMGPTEDGGFYLFGGSKKIPAEVWLETPYSVDSTCSEFLKRLKPYGKVIMHSSLFDIDTVDDLRRLADLNNDYKVYLEPTRNLS